MPERVISVLVLVVVVVVVVVVAIVWGDLKRKQTWLVQEDECFESIWTATKDT